MKKQAVDLHLGHMDAAVGIASTTKLNGAKGLRVILHGGQYRAKCQVGRKMVSPRRLGSLAARILWPKRVSRVIASGGVGAPKNVQHFGQSFPSKVPIGNTVGRGPMENTRDADGAT
jgi:hypothetical protein